MNHGIYNRRMDEIEEDMLSLMNEIEQGNKDYHDRCDEHECQGCAPVHTNLDRFGRLIISKIQVI